MTSNQPQIQEETTNANVELQTGPRRLLQLCSVVFGRARSKCTGKLMRLYIPRPMRSAVLGAYVSAFGIDTEEIEKPVHEYTSLSHFFSRRLKPEARRLSATSRGDFELVSPVDGLLMNYFKLPENTSLAWVPQIKGSTYHVPSLVGEHPLPAKPGNCYYSMVIYLSPADYHHFHAPCDVTWQKRRHFAGEVLPVAPRFAGRVRNLFALQERVSLSGKWQGGNMYYCAVAAYNVGDIRLTFDKCKTNRLGSPKNQSRLGAVRNSIRAILRRDQFEFNQFGSGMIERDYEQLARLTAEASLSREASLEVECATSKDMDLTPSTSVGSYHPDETAACSRTPEKLIFPTSGKVSSSQDSKLQHRSRSCSSSSSSGDTVTDFPEGVHLTPQGFHCPIMSEIGEFKMGSTICMIFEAPKDFNFTLQPGTKLNLGQSMGHC